MELNNESPPSSGNAPNNSTKLPITSMAEKYRIAYDTIFFKLDETNKALILSAVTNPDVKSRVLDLFIKDVIELAEKQDEVPIKKQ